MPVTGGLEGRRVLLPPLAALTQRALALDDAKIQETIATKLI